jgi:hypothetical protein
MPKKPPAEVQAYLSKLAGDRRRTINELRNAVLRANSSLMETLNPWGYVTFSSPRARYAFTIVPHETHANLQIFNGASLAAEMPELEGSGKNLRHIKFAYGKSVDRSLVARAVRLSLAV